MASSLPQLLARWIVLALGVLLAAKIVPGIRFDDAGSLVAVVILLSLANTFIKPLLVLFTLPFILVTMGIGMIVINALLFLFVGRLVAGFHVLDFWSAMWGACVITVVNFFISRVLRTPRPPPRRGPPGNGETIDI